MRISDILFIFELNVTKIFRVIQLIGYILGAFFLVCTSLFFYINYKNKTEVEEVFLKIIKGAEYYDVAGLDEVPLISLKDKKNGIEIDLKRVDRKGSYLFHTDDVSIWRSMPEFFRDVELGAQDIYCVQGRVRKKRSDNSFEKYEDKFFVMYDNVIFSRSLDSYVSENPLFVHVHKQPKIDQENSIREYLEYKWESNTENISSNSALFNGNCHDTFRGWISSRESFSKKWSSTYR
jgi:hypothetical protein